MTSFAERQGYRAVRSITQTDALDEQTRTEIWNVTNTLRTVLNDQTRRYRSKTCDHILSAVWTWEFRRPADEQPSDSAVWSRIKSTILTEEWFDALDLVEAIVGYVKRFEDQYTQGAVPAIVGAFNDRFERFLVEYRFIGLEVTPIASSAEAGAVTGALDATAAFNGARHHLERAVELLADRHNPDFPNSIKESISAVEAVCVSVTGEHTLGSALKRLEVSGVSIHPALAVAWSKMYGWVSDADGIRHGSIEAPDADQALAKYMLVTCSAFVSHVIEVGRKAGLI
ncbi:hypothetical protein E3T61_04785 [Cryobacterium lactosi]|uniref:HEPN AbiJ-N-terminal domain-containing protein n=1 Tax=Cryobacterium lactosi TaxID=1259202 RepID=A0A4R9BX54_9MICO|nr:hypothetical protein [Cryobacterium lactosi]TFD93410.1 hypothetical protein E3T61_04785 [Cryobacterium lactosi]